jgi:membrane protein YqaA with SNARE-associated domain
MCQVVEAQSRKLVKVLGIIWIGVIVYIILYYNVPAISSMVDGVKGAMESWAMAYSNLMVLISLLISFLGSASIGIPIPFVLVLFSFGQSIFNGYLGDLGSIDAVFANAGFWGQMMSNVIAAGLGCALGESTSYLVGRGIKTAFEKKKLKKENEDARSKQDGNFKQDLEPEPEEKKGLLNNMDGFGKLLNKNPRAIPFFVFVFALTPAPDDALYVPLGLIKYPFWKCLIPGWLGKIFTTFFYMFYPVLISMGVLAAGGGTESMGGNVFGETFMFGISITIILSLMLFDWNKLVAKLEEVERLKLLKKEEKAKSLKRE